MSETNNCTDCRQMIQKILDASIALKHSIDFSQYINVDEDELGVKTFTVDNQLFTDVAKLMWPEEFTADWSDNEIANFVESMYRGTMRYKALLFQECQDNWQILYNRIRLKHEILLGDAFFFGRSIDDSILEELQHVYYVGKLDDLIIDIQHTFGPERISDKLPYGSTVRWVCTVPQQILNYNLTYTYGNTHDITTFDMIYGYQIYSRLHALIEIELLTEYKPTVNDKLIIGNKSYTLFANTLQRCLYWKTDDQD